jgi:3-hydroxybutyryl-CoA dehydrogenase
MSGPVGTMGVVGAGTMGAGIAQLAAQAGARTLLHDPVPGATERALEQIAQRLRRDAERGRTSQDDARAAAGRLAAAPALEDLAPCELVVEAAPERLALKGELFAALAAITDGVLASNTSSIPITAIGAASGVPERVVGMHFFNPPPVMRLLEVIAGVQTGAAAVATARAMGEAMGRHVIEVADGPGFLVNRCNRPFSGEGLRLLAERLAPVEEIDRILRLGGGFPMGPFELMDLVGIDVGFEVARSFHEQSYGEPRWRPSPLAARQVAAGQLGRKTGRGWYAYGDGPHRPADADAPAPGGGAGLVVLSGDTVLAAEVHAAASAAGWDVRAPEEAEGEVPVLCVDAGLGDEQATLQGGPQVLLCAAGSLATLDEGGSAAGFHALAPVRPGGLVELTRGPDTSPAAADAAELFFASLGQHTAWVQDAPGLVLGRVVAQLVNEAAFALGEGVGAPADVDAGMVLGLNHPVGPLQRGDELGLDHVLAVLDALHDELGEERYRAAPLLRRLVATGRLGVATGSGLRES